MDALRQSLFGISLGTAAAQSHLDLDEYDEVRQALLYVACAAREAYRQLETLESNPGGQGERNTP